MYSINLEELPLKRQSVLSLVLGILTTIIGFFQMMAGIPSALYYQGDGGTWFFMGIITMLFGIAFISLGNRKVIDQDYFVIFLKELIKKETEKTE